MPETLCPRERVLLALNHKEPDRVPLTLGGSANHLAEQRYELLREHFKFQDVPRRTLVGFYTTPDYAPLLDCLGTDFRFIHIRPPHSYIANSLLGNFQEFTDEWGLTHRMLGGYYDLAGAPLGRNLHDLSVRQIETYPWPNPYDPVRAGFGAAARLTGEHHAAERVRLGALRQQLVAGLRERVPDVVVNGPAEACAAHVISLSFPHADAEAMLFRLNAAGFAVSTGSACTSKSIEPSHVLTAMGLSPEHIDGTLRLSLGYPTRADEIDAFLEAIPAVVSASTVA